MSPTTQPIALDELPAHMRRLAQDIERVGASIRYHGGFGPFGEWGDLLETQTAPMCAYLATELETMRGNRA